MFELIHLLLKIAELFTSAGEPLRSRENNTEGVKVSPYNPNAPRLRNWIQGLWETIRKPTPETLAQRALSDARQAEIVKAIQKNQVPGTMRERLAASRDGTSPWIATLTPAELRIARTHGIRPVAAVSATCWMNYRKSWTKGHEQGWQTALARLREAAKAAGANAVLDVKMRTIPMGLENSMDFSLVGTAVKVDGLPASSDPVIATVPALEFVKLLEADIVAAGIAIGAEYRWITDYQRNTRLTWAGNTECITLTDHWKYVRNRAFYNLHQSVKTMGNGALAYINFSQIIKQESYQFLARHIVIATVVDTKRDDDWKWGKPPEAVQGRLPDFQPVVDLHAGKTPLAGGKQRHQSYGLNENDGPI